MKRLVLVGAGHAHAQVLQGWITQPVPGVELVVVSPSALAPYSGMVPGWLAGHYRFDEICIDFAALCRAAGARFVFGEACALDAGRSLLGLSSGTELAYDALSLNIGSTLMPPALGAGQLLSLRPLGELRRAWEALLEDMAKLPVQRTLRLTAVGGGAAGIEALLAVRQRLAMLHPNWQIESQLISRSLALLPGMARGAARRVNAALARASATVQLNTAFDAASTTEHDLVLWATGAQAHAWPQHSALACGASGFVQIDAQLRSVSHANVFAVGDCADWLGTGHADALPKAGVFAVRQGPDLSHNLRAFFGVGAMQAHRPRHRYLALLATADGSAILAWDRFAAQGRWAWRWKDRIDRGFLARFATQARSRP